MLYLLINFVFKLVIFLNFNIVFVRLFLILILSIFSIESFAQSQSYSSIEEDPDLNNPRKEIFNPRTPTPNRIFSAELSKPDEFVSSNNLIKKTGSFYQAVGEVILLKGKVVDSFGVPISGAVVEIWQTNSAGKYQSLLDKDSEYMDVNFNMSGKAITDNLGNYSFLTIMPGSYLNRAPHINMNIYHQQFGKIETEVYFENHPKNESDYEYLSYNEEDRKLVTAKVKLSNIFDQNSYKECLFDVVMDGVDKFRTLGGI